MTRHGTMVVGHGHCLYVAGKEGFKQSPALQYIACMLGQEMPFDRASEIYKLLTNNELSDKQIERLSHHYGQEVATVQAEELAKRPFKQDDELTYLMMDGSMVQVRDEGWREIKLGRIFKAKDCVQVKERGEVLRGEYVCHFGNHTDFLAKLDPIADGLTNLVAINDGAPWIWDHIATSYPDAVQILDFFHAHERIAEFAKQYFEDSTVRTQWVETQIKALKNDEITNVIATIKQLSCSTAIEPVKAKILTYLSNNQSRMYYKTYQDKGYLIDSGAIEAAHRNVIQQRLKLSGQRWTAEGLQQVANLRVLFKNKQENKLRAIIAQVA